VPPPRNSFYHEDWPRAFSALFHRDPYGEDSDEATPPSSIESLFALLNH
jgi:hypothetical protein